MGEHFHLCILMEREYFFYVKYEDLYATMNHPTSKILKIENNYN